MKPNEEQRDEAIRLYQSGMGAPKVARRLGCATGTVYNILRDRGVPNRALSLATRVFDVDDSFLSAVSRPEQAWLVGLLSSDGCISKRGNAITLALKAADVGCLEMVQRLIGHHGKIRITERRVYGDTAITRAFRKQVHEVAILGWCSAQMKADLAALGVVPAKSLILNPWQPPPELESHFLRGLVDGDGFVLRGGRKYASGAPIYKIGICGTLPVVEAFCRFANRVCGSNAQPVPQVSIWTTQVVGYRMPAVLAKALYGGATCFLSRKKAIADEMIASLDKDSARPRKWFGLTLEQLDALRDEHGAWENVARSLGTGRGILRSLRRRLLARQ